MRIVARIEKIAGEQYLLDGRVFDSFLSARREMTQRMRARRAERQTRGKLGTSLILATMQCVERPRRVFESARSLRR